MWIVTLRYTETIQLDDPENSNSKRHNNLELGMARANNNLENDFLFQRLVQMLYSRALRCVGLVAIAAACVACGDATGPTSPEVAQPSRLTAPTNSVQAALTGPASAIAEPPKYALPETPLDAIFTRWILISGVWVEVDDVMIAK